MSENVRCVLLVVHNGFYVKSMTYSGNGSMWICEAVSNVRDAARMSRKAAESIRDSNLNLGDAYQYVEVVDVEVD